MTFVGASHVDVVQAEDRSGAGRSALDAGSIPAITLDAPLIMRAETTNFQPGMIGLEHRAGLGAISTNSSVVRAHAL